jgi:hypothetical protein
MRSILVLRIEMEIVASLHARSLAALHKELTVGFTD